MNYQQGTELLGLIRDLTPELNNGEYVYCTIPSDKKIEGLEVIAEFLEKEGRTVILERNTARVAGLSYDATMSWITLNVYSSLEAVGLTAVVSDRLARGNISCNMVAAFHHDHVFVPKDDADKAMKILSELSREFKTD